MFIMGVIYYVPFAVVWYIFFTNDESWVHMDYEAIRQSVIILCFARSFRCLYISMITHQLTQQITSQKLRHVTAYYEAVVYPTSKWVYYYM